MNGAEIIDNLREHYTGRGVIQDGVTHAVTGELVKRPGETARDTREKLEADVHRAADELDRLYNGERFINTHKIIGWLDRQSAITKAEVMGHPEIADLQCQVEELTSQLDQLKELNEYNAAQYRSACDDVDRLTVALDSRSRRVEGLLAKCQSQREELARLNERVHGKRQLPKKVKWPRFPDGKLVKIGRDCQEVQLLKHSYTLLSANGASFAAEYGSPVPVSWHESQWRLR